MTQRSFNYYGYTRDAYYSCSSLIHSMNKNHILILNSWFAIVNVFYLVFSFFNLFGATQELMLFYMIFTGISIAFGVWLVLFPSFAERHNFSTVFASITILMTYGIIHSVSHPYMPATMFLILLTIVSVSFIGRMYLMIALVFTAAIAFLVTSYKFKTFSIAYRDSYNVAIVATLAATLHYTFQRMRIAQFILFQKDEQTRKELEIKSSFDPLTMLLSRGYFFSAAEEIVRLVMGENMYLCLLDLDGFKGINDTLGHQMGDKVIQTVGKVILRLFDLEKNGQCVSEWDLTRNIPIAGRLGGDEFIILLRMESPEQTEKKMRELMDRLSEVKFDGLDGIRTSVGVTEITGDDRDLDAAYKRADDALYESKRAGKNQITIG